MASVFQQQVTQATNTKRSAEGARAEAQQARAGITTPNADNLIAQGDVYLTAGNDLLARGHPADATAAYAAANAHFNDATADAERERAALAASAAAAAAAKQAAAAAAQQAAIAQQRQQAAIAQAAAATAAQQAQAAAKVQAALNAKAAAVAANTQALKTIAAQPSKPSPAPVPAGRPVAQPVSSRPSPPPARHPAPARPPKHNPVRQTPAPVAQAAGALMLYRTPLDAAQIAVIREIISVGRSAGASALVIKAAIYAGAGESTLRVLTGDGGVFQTTCNMAAYDSGSDLAAQAQAFYDGGECFARGAKSYADEYSTIWQIANATEENAVWGNSRGDSYTYPGRESANVTTSELEAEVTAVYDALAGTPPPKGRPKYGAPPGPPAPTPRPVASGAWNGNPAGQQLEAAFHQLHTTLKTWNPGFRHQLSLRARQPIGG